MYQTYIHHLFLSHSFLSVCPCVVSSHRHPPCLLLGVLRDTGGEQLPSPEGTAGEAEGDCLPEEEAGGEGASYSATGEAYQVSR